MLVQKAQGGDRQALGLLWDTLTPKLFGYLVNTLRDHSLAEDILQTTWLRAIEALISFKPRGIGFSAWLFAIARNECRQYWRKQNREIPFDPIRHEQTSNDQKELENKISADQILNLLSEEDRELIRLRYLADLPVNEIALILKLNFVTVRVRIHRALARLRTAAATHLL